MLKRLHLKNFTVFADADFEFSPGLNVLVGTNGTGKSHVLKVGYAVLSALSKLLRWKDNGLDQISIESNFRKELHDKLSGVFQPEREDLRQLVRWKTPQNETVIDVEYSFDNLSKLSFSISKAEAYKSLIKVNKQPEIGRIFNPVFIPAKEVLTLAWISRILEYRDIPIDETYTDLLNALRPFPLTKPEESTVSALVELEKIVGGTIKQAGERFYLISEEGVQVEMDLVAEGIRKFGTLSQLLANGSITKNTTLFWDEPEANLNPLLLRKLAAILAELARQGFQIILATHSMSLLKEFHILSRQKEKGNLPIHYFGLNAELGHATTLLMRKDFEYLPDVVALTVELEQADDLEEIFVREDREYYANNRGEE